MNVYVHNFFSIAKFVQINDNPIVFRIVVFNTHLFDFKINYKITKRISYYIKKITRLFKQILYLIIWYVCLCETVLRFPIKSMSDNEKTPSLIIDEKQQLDSNKSILSDTGTIYSQSGLYI